MARALSLPSVQRTATLRVDPVILGPVHPGDRPCVAAFITPRFMSERNFSYQLPSEIEGPLIIADEELRDMLENK